MSFEKQEGIMVSYYRTINSEKNEYSSQYWNLSINDKGEIIGSYNDNPSYTVEEKTIAGGEHRVCFYRYSKLFHSTTMDRLAQLDKQFDEDLNKIIHPRFHELANCVK